MNLLQSRSLSSIKSLVSKFDDLMKTYSEEFRICWDALFRIRQVVLCLVVRNSGLSLLGYLSWIRISLFRWTYDRDGCDDKEWFLWELMHHSAHLPSKICFDDAWSWRVSQFADRNIQLVSWYKLRMFYLHDTRKEGWPCLKIYSSMILSIIYSYIVFSPVLGISWILRQRSHWWYASHVSLAGV